MSAFLCSPAHIGQLAAFVRRDPHRQYEPEELAETFARANLDSVACRYRDLNGIDAVAREFGGFETAERYVQACIVEALQPCTMTTVEALKAVQCLDYQSCEVPDWANSKPAWRLRALQSVAISLLPGYDAAPWEWSLSARDV